LPFNSMGLITDLEDNEVFVFGSNTAGRHGSGAARLALKKFGAVYGQGEGFTGSCYALPTLDDRLKRLPHQFLWDGVQIFLDIARKRGDLTFLLTKVGCGLAGYPEPYMRSMFIEVPKNVKRPPDWEEFFNVQVAQ
jgi:hypothetical protein